MLEFSRRGLLLSAAAAPFLHPQAEDLLAQTVRRHDESVGRLLERQITDPKHPWCGIFADEFGLHHPGSAAGVIDAFITAYLHPRSRFHKDPALPKRAQLAAALLDRVQTPDGNIDLPITNFNSPPDTAFAVRGVSTPALLAKREKQAGLFAMVEPFLRRAGGGLVRGGIHTPNHRWVVCAALAQLYELFRDAGYVRRIDQWLAEGIDIDPEGQYNERSTAGYNAITNSALITVAAKLKRPQLLEPVRKNLENMLYLLHPDYEVVTEISRRQDRNQRGDMGSYWFSLQYMAAHDRDGRFATLARHFAPARAGLSALMEYPELLETVPLQPVPDNYRRDFPHNHLVRIRRGPMSATILTHDNSRVFTLRNGKAVINAVRFASAFFGKAQFIPAQVDQTGRSIRLVQNLSGPYFQPFDPPRRISADEWDTTRPLRRQSEVARLEQSATIAETGRGFSVRIQAHGTNGVPLAIEINLREGGEVIGVVAAPKVQNGWLLQSGHATYRVGSDVIRFGPGTGAHAYTQVRGAEPKLEGPSVYLTGFTPFDHTLEFECHSG
jgi:hypothetical protein